MKLSKTNQAFVFAFAVILAGCSNRDRRASEIDFNQLFFEYTITGDENLANVTCFFQYKTYDAEGEAVNIEPARVELDGQEIKSDSTKLSGTYYEIQKPVDSFAGKHTIVFIAPERKQYKNEFEFYPFTLEEELPARINRGPITIQLKNFPKRETPVRLLLLDTAFESSGFNDLIPVVNGRIVIGEEILANLKNGPVNLELYMEQEIPLKQATKAGGGISITYGLKREFELQD